VRGVAFCDGYADMKRICNASRRARRGVEGAARRDRSGGARPSGHLPAHETALQPEALPSMKAPASGWRVGRREDGARASETSLFYEKSVVSARCRLRSEWGHRSAGLPSMKSAPRSLRLLLPGAIGDIGTTYLSTPNLILEANPNLRKLGCPLGSSTVRRAYLPYVT